MGCCLKSFGVITIILALGLFIIWQKVNDIPKLPDFQLDVWASGAQKADDKSIKSFKISFSNSVLTDLEARLNNTRPFTKPLEGIGFQYGFNTDYLTKLVQFWKTEYKWKEREAFLNSVPHFITEISGLDIHFIHVKPNKAQGKSVLPLLLLHGWPGSVREFYEIIPKLTTPRKDVDFVFEVIAPSLPGYGFSEGAGRPGLGPAQMGVIFNELMSRLGHEKYFVQGGDWGALIGRCIALLFPDRVSGFHSNMCPISSTKAKLQMFAAYLFPSIFVEEGKQEEFSKQFSNLLLESGYLHLQATKPDTIGIALNDSPVGLAAYILEKFSTWTNKAWRNLSDGGLDKYNKIDLLDNIMIYWLTGSITTSVRLYSEALCQQYQDLKLDEHEITVPSSCARFPNEIMYIPDIVIKSAYKNLVQLTDYPQGGHFAAFEVPNILADDIFNFIDKLRKKQAQKQNKKASKEEM